MWGIITFAVCFMLACVMLISGNGGIGKVRNSIQDTIITKEIDAQTEKRALTYYTTAADGLDKFDSLFAENASDTLSCLVWCSEMPTLTQYPDPTYLKAATEQWQKSAPTPKTEVGKTYSADIKKWLKKCRNKVIIPIQASICPT